VQRFARKWAPFAGWILVVVSVWALLNRHHFDPQNDRSDAWMAFVAAVVVFVSILIMLVDTAQWSIRRLGVFGLVLSVCLLYALIASVTLWHWTVASQRDYNWIRTLLLVSSPLLFISQLRYIAARIGEWRERRNADE
jgi:hypothetical protein